MRCVGSLQSPTCHLLALRTPLAQGHARLHPPSLGLQEAPHRAHCLFKCLLSWPYAHLAACTCMVDNLQRHILLVCASDMQQTPCINCVSSSSWMCIQPRCRAVIRLLHLHPSRQLSRHRAAHSTPRAPQRGSSLCTTTAGLTFAVLHCTSRLRRVRRATFISSTGTTGW